ncbi:MAG: hypothetical protein AB7T20_12770 [Steroidobacteraceae bacterium]
MKIAVTCLAALFASLVLAQGASAQVNEKFADMAGEIELLRSVAQTERQAIVARAMILTDQEAAAFWPVYGDYRTAVGKLNDQLVRLITDYAAQRDTITDEQAKTLLSNHIKFEQDLLKLRKKYIPKFGKAIPMTKVARFYQIENKLDLLQRLGLARDIPLAR